MSHSVPDATSKSLRTAVYALLIVTAVGGMLGRLGAIRSPLGGTAMLSANDRSRWATVRALVDHGTFAIDEVVFKDAARTKRDREWYTIDMVRHRGADGAEHYYSSKPPLLAVLLVPEYWLLQKVTGATLADQPFYVIRLLLIAVNVLPLVVYFVLLARLIERLGTTDWGRLFVMTTAVAGTFLTTFAVTLNNHLPAAVCVLITVSAALPIWRDGERRWRYFVVAGFFAAFSAAHELPALSFAVLVGAALCWKVPGRTLATMLPAALLAAGAATVTNYLAHGSWRPPYAHRGNGELLATVPGGGTTQLDQGEIPGPLRQRLAERSVKLSPQAVVRPRTMDAGWVLWDVTSQTRLALVATGDELRVHAWDHWYEYDGSYWASDQKSDVDCGEPSRIAYAFHVLLGHHGVFSLTPVWCLSLVGLVQWLRRDDATLRGIAWGVGLLTVVCLGFFILRPLMDRNYGGATCGFRWAFWLIPLWLLTLLPAVDAIAGRPRWRYVALALLLISAGSAAYAALNPWSHPWLYKYWTALGWVQP
jgi:hypothetical protein